MSKYIIPNLNTPCKTALQKNKLPKKLIITILVIICTSITLYILFSAFFMFFPTKNQLTPTQNYYLVFTTDTNNDINLTTQEAKNIKMRGGAGNIISSNDKFHIALHAYLSEEKAREISTNLAEQDIDAKVQKISVIQHNLNNYTPADQQNILSNINFIFDLLNTLYDIISQFDTLNITENKLYTHIHKLKISCDLELSSLTSLTNFETNPIYLQMLEITSIIESLCNRDFNGYNITTISSEFKYSFVQILITICTPFAKNSS